jgi:hypothetical protein
MPLTSSDVPGNQPTPTRRVIDGDMCVYLTEDEASAVEELLWIASNESLVSSVMLSAVNQVLAARGRQPISANDVD